MKTFTINVPDNCNPSNLGFATALVTKAESFTSEDINLKVDDGSYVNLKSILGVLALNYNKSREITIQITGEMEDYAAAGLERFIKKLLTLYTTEA